MKLNLDVQFLNLKGVPLPIKMADYLANVLALASVGPPAKMMSWAVNLANVGHIELDKSDAGFLINLISEHPHIQNLFKAQIIERIQQVG